MPIKYAIMRTQLDSSGHTKEHQVHTVATVCSLKTEERILSHKEAAEYLRLSPKALYNLCSQGKVPYLKFGRRNRFRFNDLKAFILSEPRGGFYGNKVP